MHQRNTNFKIINWLLIVCFFLLQDFMSFLLCDWIAGSSNFPHIVNLPWSLLPFVAFTSSSCFKVLFTKMKLKNHIVEIHKDPKSWISWASWGTRSPAICHSFLFGRTVQPMWQELLNKNSLSKHMMVVNGASRF